MRREMTKTDEATRTTIAEVAPAAQMSNQTSTVTVFSGWCDWLNEIGMEDMLPTRGNNSDALRTFELICWP